MFGNFRTRSEQDRQRSPNHGGGHEDWTTPVTLTSPARALGDIPSVETTSVVGSFWRQTPGPVQTSATMPSLGGLAPRPPVDMTRHRISGQAAFQPLQPAVLPPPAMRMLPDSDGRHVGGHRHDVPLPHPARSASFTSLSGGWPRPPGQSHPEVSAVQRMPEGPYHRPSHTMVSSSNSSRVGGFPTGVPAGDSAAQRGPDLGHFVWPPMAAPPSTSDLGSRRINGSGSLLPLETTYGFSSPASVFAPRIFESPAPDAGFAPRSAAGQNAAERRPDSGHFSWQRGAVPPTTPYPRPPMMNGSRSLRPLWQSHRELSEPDRPPGDGDHLPPQGSVIPQTLTRVDGDTSQSANLEKAAEARPRAAYVASPPTAGPLKAPDLGSRNKIEATTTGEDGELAQAQSTCHGCRNQQHRQHRSSVLSQTFCMYDDVGRCPRWLCSACLSVYSTANEGLEDWVCHDHKDETMPPCPCRRR